MSLHEKNLMKDELRLRKIFKRWLIIDFISFIKFNNYICKALTIKMNNSTKRYFVLIIQINFWLISVSKVKIIL